MRKYSKSQIGILTLVEHSTNFRRSNFKFSELLEERGYFISAKHLEHPEYVGRLRTKILAFEEIASGRSNGMHGKFCSIYNHATAKNTITES